MGVIHWGVMDSGDPHGFYGSMFVFFAMMVLDYNNPYSFYKDNYKKSMTALTGFLALICFFGVIKIFTITSKNQGYYMSISDTMNKSGLVLFNIHHIFFALYGMQVIIAVFEWLVKVKKIDIKEVNVQ